MKSPPFNYAKPASLDEAFALLEEHGEEARLLAGGQSLLASLNMRLSSPALLIDINGLPDLAGIAVSGDRLVIGAMTRHRALETSPVVARHLPLIAEAMAHVGHPAIRNRGTFGGSIAFADPAAELPACCVALDAEFVLASRRGTRRLPARDFFKGLYETALQDGEILVAAEFPLPGPDHRSAFDELARRHGDYAVIGLAAHGRLDGGVFGDLRLVFFSAGDRPVEARGAAQRCLGHPPSDALIAEATAALDADLDPPSDPVTSSQARRHLAKVLLARALGRLSRGTTAN